MKLTEGAYCVGLGNWNLLLVGFLSNSALAEENSYKINLLWSVKV